MKGLEKLSILAIVLTGGISNVYAAVCNSVGDFESGCTVTSQAGDGAYVEVIPECFPYYPGSCPGDQYVPEQHITIPGRVDAKLFPANNTSPANLGNIAVFVNGFDPEGEMSISGFSGRMNVHGLIDDLQDTGHDVVVLNYGQESRNYIQSQGAAVTRTLKILDNLGPSSQSVAVVGFSMGGLAARYALAQMEHSGSPHKVRTYISIDSPHRGANIPVSVQRLPAFFSQTIDRVGDEIEDLQTHFSVAGMHDFAYALDQFVEDDLDDLIAISDFGLSSRAAKQMLLNYHTVSGHSALFDEWQSDLSSVGYPKKVRKIAFSNGSVTGNRVNSLPPNGRILDFSGSRDVGIGGVSIELDIRDTQPDTQVFRGKVRGPVLEEVEGLLGEPLGYRIGHTNYNYEEFDSRQSHDAYDGLPGSIQMNEAVSAVNSLGELFNQQNAGSNVHNACFVPTFSSLDLDLDALNAARDSNFLSLAQLYHDTGDLAEFTPFNEVYYPMANGQGLNRSHDEISPETSVNLLNEIKSRHDLAWLVPVNALILM